jgi:chromosome segregation ATPase
MKRLLSVILVGAAIVVAQPADSTGKMVPFQGKDLSQITTQLRQHLDSCMHQADIDVAKARQAAEEFQKQMAGKTPEEIKAACEARRTQANVELQNAISRLENASADVKAQVEEAAAKIQARLQEKADELKAIQARIEAHRAEIQANKPVTTPPTGN